MRARVLMPGVLVGLLGAILVTGPAIAATELVIAVWSGGYDKIFEEKVLADFLKQRDVKPRWVLGGSVANIAKVKATRDNPEIDVVIADDLPQRGALQEGLWAALDPQIVTNLADVRKLARLPGDQGVGFALNISGLVYHGDVFKERNLAPLTSWNDLFREDLRKRVVLSQGTSGEMLILMIQMARQNGGGEQNMDPGFAKLRELAPRVLDFTTTAMVGALFQRREAWVTVMPLDWAALLKQKGVPAEFVLPREGAPARTYTISVVKNTPKARLAQELINHMLSPRVQEKVAEELKVAPVNQRSTVSPEVAGMLDKLYPLDMDHINRVRPQWIERWNREVEGK